MAHRHSFILALALLACMQRNAEAQILGTAESFAVLGASTVTNTGPSVISGNLGVWSGSAVSGFPPGIVVDGVIHAGDAVAMQAQSDATTAYNTLAGMASNQDLTGQDLGGMTLLPGVYTFSSSAQLTGTLTLNTLGDPDALFVFQIGSTLITASNSSVVTINGPNDCNIYWQVGSSATLGTDTQFMGTIIALASVGLDTGANIEMGRAIARTGAVTLDDNSIIAGCTCILTVDSDDCNGNGIPDECDIADETSADCNVNGIPDECELVGNDCNANGVPDECELFDNDCNSNGIPDECEVDCNNNGTPDDCEIFTDCNVNGIPDECELVGNDCNANGIPDDCELDANDCNSNGIPDECEGLADCNSNGVPDICELVGNDCNSNGVPDDCELLLNDCNANGILDECENFTDCNSNGVPDECELVGNDCNSNGVPDECDVDCDGNGTPDDCEIFADCNDNSIPDACELLGNDCNSNGIPDDCELDGNDCNANGILDECESLTDCNSNGTPDVCEIIVDCNGNGIPDECELIENDCNSNGIPDDCETLIDCNANSIPDVCELLGNDCNSNGIPDECEVDCNSNGIPDDCEVFTDCNGNSIPDECELFENDCNSNSIPDECDLLVNDCNANGIPDDCEEFTDCNSNSIPDFCELIENDCNANGVPDDCEVDCNSNGTPDDCETFTDCNTNGIPDECELIRNDCNSNGIPDDCETFVDCNGNGVPDFCDITDGTSFDCNTNGIPDECDGGCDAGCSEFNRYANLTPNDTLTLVTNFHNPQSEQGYVYVYAVNDGNAAISFDRLVGQLLIVNGLETMEYSVNALDFRSMLPEGNLTDLDSDGNRDLNGLEYELAPGSLLVPRFIGQVPGQTASQLVLIGLSGGTEFDTAVDFLIYNDNEDVFSKEFTFRCWDKVDLLQISNIFSNSFLANGSNSDPSESLRGREYGWFRMTGGVASSMTMSIDEPAIYGVYIERVGSSYAAADLPFEICTRSGHLRPQSLFGDNEEQAAGGASDRNCSENIARRRPGTLLIYPEFDNRAGVLSILTLTNTSPNEDVRVNFKYIGRYGN